MSVARPEMPWSDAVADPRGGGGEGRIATKHTFTTPGLLAIRAELAISGEEAGIDIVSLAVVGYVVVTVQKIFDALVRDGIWHAIWESC